MRIGQRAQAQLFRPVVLAGPLRIANVEPLIGRETIDWLQVLSLRGILPSHVSQPQSAQVGNVFAAGQLAVDVDIVHHDVLTPRPVKINILCRFVRVGKSNLEAMIPNGADRLIPEGT